MSAPTQDQPIDLGNDDGFAEIGINGVWLTLDVWQVHEQLRELYKKTKDKGDDALGEAIQGFLTSLGYPRVSHKMAHNFMLAIQARLEDVKKNPADGSESSGSSPA